MIFRVLHIILFSIPSICIAQIFVSNQAGLHVDNNAQLFLSQNITNQGTVDNGGTIQIVGNWNNQGVYNPIGTVILQGGDQDVNQSGNSFYNLIITGGGNKNFTNRTYVSNSLDLQNGYIIPVDTAKIILLDNAKPTVGSELSFVKGVLYAKGTGTKYFPVGMNALFLPAELHQIEGTNPIVGISSHEFIAPAVAGKGSREVFTNAYWKLDVLSGTYKSATISLALAPEFMPNYDSVIVVQAISPISPFTGIGANSEIPSTIPDDYITSKDTAKGPIFALGILLDVNWDLFYIPNALSSNSSNSEETCVKIYGNLFLSEGFSFTVTNQWGNKVFETSSLIEMETKGWTGVNNKTYKREATGQYFYYLYATAKDKTLYNKAGSLWIID